jgi:hypothetical protein
MQTWEYLHSFACYTNLDTTRTRLFSGGGADEHSPKTPPQETGNGLGVPPIILVHALRIHLEQ